MTDMDKMIEPCPFCGGEAELRDPHGAFSRLAAVFCNECEIRGQLSVSAQLAVEQWNTRAYNPDDRLREALEALRKIDAIGERSDAVNDMLNDALAIASKALAPTRGNERISGRRTTLFGRSESWMI